MVENIKHFKVSYKILFISIYLAIFCLIGIISLKKILLAQPDTYSYNSDYLNFYTGGTIVNGNNTAKLYDPETQINTQRDIFSKYTNYTTILGFRSLPFVAYFVSIFSNFSFIASMKVFLIVNLSFIIYVIKKHSETFSDYLFYLLLFISFYPAIISIEIVQITFIMSGLFGLGLLALKKDKALLAGTIFSWVLIKPQYVILIPFILLITNKKKLFLLGFSSASLLLIVVGTSKLGLYFLPYIKFALKTETIAFGTNFNAISSLQGLFSKFFENPFFLTKTAVGMLLPIYYGVFYKTYKNRSFALNTLVISCIVLGLSLHSFMTDYLLLFFPLILILKENRESLFLIVHILLQLTLLKLEHIYAPLMLTLSLFLIYEKHIKEFYKSIEFKSKTLLKLIRR